MINKSTDSRRKSKKNIVSHNLYKIKTYIKFALHAFADLLASHS